MPYGVVVALPDVAGKIRRLHAKPVNFEIGDYVMLLNMTQSVSKNSRPTWTGPYRVVSAYSEWDFEIQHLVTGVVQRVHSARLDYYCDSSLQVTSALKEQVVHDESVAEAEFTIDAVLGHRFDDDGLFLLIAWKGFSADDNTWEPANVIFEDCPSVVKAYVRSLSGGIRSKFRKLLPGS